MHGASACPLSGLARQPAGGGSPPRAVRRLARWRSPRGPPVVFTHMPSASTLSCHGVGVPSAVHEAVSNHGWQHVVRGWRSFGGGCCCTVFGERLVASTDGHTGPRARRGRGRGQAGPRAGVRVVRPQRRAVSADEDGAETRTVLMFEADARTARPDDQDRAHLRSRQRRALHRHVVGAPQECRWLCRQCAQGW